MATGTFTIKNDPEADDLWAGIGGHFDNICQILCEFIDNSVSNYICHKCGIRDVNIVLTELEPDGAVKISVQDTGTGILNIDEAFKLGSKRASETPLNEHGFGLKHALASANPTNDDWSVKTCTKSEWDNNIYREICAPYKIGSNFCGEVKEGWNKEETGTIIEFKCSRELLKTAARGIQGGAKNIFTLCEYIAEDLGFVYSGIIAAQNLNINITPRDYSGTKKKYTVYAVEPEWLDFYEPDGNGEQNFDFGGGSVKVNYKFGSIKESSYKKYYKRSMSTSGVELRINGRLMAYNLFKEIWNIEKHNSYNYFLGVIDIISQNRDALPTTRTSKNGIREGDPKLDAIFEWILNKVPTPKKDPKDITHETELFEELCKAKNKHGGTGVSATVQQAAYMSLRHNPKIRIDLYVNDNNNIIIYEGKRNATEPLDVYQLLMYWDGLVKDGISPSKGILIASSHEKYINDLVEHVNTLVDANGNHYCIETRIWRDEDIEYPVLRTEE